MHMITFENVGKKFRKERAVRNVSFTIKEGEMVFITGVSGSGKTTIMRMLNKELKPKTGKVYMFGKNIRWQQAKKLRRKIGVVYQHYDLLEKKTVMENVAYPLACLGKAPWTIKKEAKQALSEVHMLDAAHKKPNQLSGGQQQRVAIARAMVTNPRLLVCDEPTGNLDKGNAKGIMECLKKLNEKGTTVVMITHSEEILASMNKRVLHLDKGSLISDGPFQVKLLNGEELPKRRVAKQPPAKKSETLAKFSDEPQTKKVAEGRE